MDARGPEADARGPEADARDYDRQFDLVLCTLNDIGGYVHLGVHVLPGSFRVRVHAALAPAFPTAESELVARAAIEHLSLAKTRDLLASLDFLTVWVQEQYERTRRAQTRVLGRPHALATMPYALLAHDVCTLYSVLSLSVLPTRWLRRGAMETLAGTRLPDACGACGLQAPWSVSCYLPTGARRRAVPDPVAWCWQCRRVFSATDG